MGAPELFQTVTHSVVKGSDPFTVEFVHLPTGKKKIEYYGVPLTQKEIEAEYPYIVFDGPV